jgi:hypothetical protein
VAEDAAAEIAQAEQVDDTPSTEPPVTETPAGLLVVETPESAGAGEEASILPPALREQALAEEAAQVERPEAEATEVEMGSVEPGAEPESEQVAAAAIIEDELPASIEVTDEGTSQSSAEALANTALETLPENVAPDSLAAQDGVAGADEQEKPADEVAAKPKRSRAKAKSAPAADTEGGNASTGAFNVKNTNIQNTNGSGTHVNGNSTEDET